MDTLLGFVRGGIKRLSLSEPIGELELNRREIPQGGVDPFTVIHILQKAADLALRIHKIAII